MGKYCAIELDVHSAFICILTSTGNGAVMLFRCDMDVGVPTDIDGDRCILL